MGSRFVGWSVRRVDRKTITPFIESWHYSGGINGCISDYCYALFCDQGMMVGAMFFGRMAMANQWKRFSSSANDVIELRRLCCKDDTPKNTESFFICKALRMLSKDWDGSTVVSYADKEHGHSGIIYRASNFIELEEIKGANVIVYNGKDYHDKTIRTKYKGVIKPYALRIKAALDSGDAFYKKTKGKHTYVYKIKRKREVKKGLMSAASIALGGEPRYMELGIINLTTDRSK